ncbi:ankyrin [Piromyces finnis]|uniref:Ankyrin n=1 Tax=Piromyces finnis TaxID=1754191 RepID=A0A1Y1VNX8_9FUNG|nr:ankyrin [Piromyces finnis]|eukprot:ORX61104.1 ankyrin [Piromyces finnis]
MNFDYIEKLLLNNKIIINIKNNNNDIPLIFSMKSNYDEDNTCKIIDILVKYNPNKDITDNNGLTALHYACQKNYNTIIPKLVTENNINIKNDNNDTPFMVMINKRNFKCAHTILLLNYHIDLNYYNNNVDLFISYLIENNCKIEFIMKMIKENDNSNYISKLKKETIICILLELIKSQSYENMKFVLDNFQELINKKYSNNNNMTLLMFSAQYCTEKHEIIDFLIKNMDNINDVDNDGFTALHYACKFNNYMSIPKLVSKENVNMKEKHYKTPLMIASEEKNYDCITSLLSTEYDIEMNISDDNKDDWIIYMIKNKISKKNIFNILLEKGAAISWKNFKKYIDYIINNEAFLQSIIVNSFNISNINKSTEYKTIKFPIIFSIQYNFVKLMEKLVYYYKNINEKDENGKPCIFYAIENKNEKYFEILLNSKKINIEEQNKEGKTALSYSFELKKEKIFKSLLQQYINIYEANKDNEEYFKKIINSKFSLLNAELMKCNNINFTEIRDIMLQLKNNEENKIKKMKELNNNLKPNLYINENIKDKIDLINNDNNKKSKRITKKKKNKKKNNILEKKDKVLNNISKETNDLSKYAIDDTKNISTSNNGNNYSTNNDIVNNDINTKKYIGDCNIADDSNSNDFNEDVNVKSITSINYENENIENSNIINIKENIDNYNIIDMNENNNTNKNIEKSSIVNACKNVEKYRNTEYSAIINNNINIKDIVNIIEETKNNNITNINKEIESINDNIENDIINIDKKIESINDNNNINIDKKIDNINDFNDEIENKEIKINNTEYCTAIENNDIYERTFTEEMEYNNTEYFTVTENNENFKNNEIVKINKIENSIITESIEDYITNTTIENDNTITDIKEIPKNVNITDINEIMIFENRITEKENEYDSNNNEVFVKEEENSNDKGNFKNEDYKISSINISNSSDEYEILEMACIIGNKIIIESLIKTYLFDVNKKIGEYQQTPLMLLISNNNYNSVDLLLHNGSNVNIKDIYGNTPFIYMLKHNLINTEIYKSLINHGAYIDYELFKNNEFLNNIIKNKEFIKLYIEKKIKVKYDGKCKALVINDPLTFAVKLDNYDFVNSLFDNDIKCDELFKSVDNPLEIVNENRNKNISQLLFKHYKDEALNNENIKNSYSDSDDSYYYDSDDSYFSPVINKKINYENYQGINYPSYNEIPEEENDESELIIDFKENYDYDVFNNKDNYEYPELHYAFINNKSDIVKIMIQYNEYVKYINEPFGEYQFTPIMISIFLENYDIAQFILENVEFINVNNRDIYKNTPFMFMLKYNKVNEDIYNSLIKREAFVDINLFKNKMFIHQICNNEIFIKLLLDKKIRVSYDETSNKIYVIEQPLIFAIHFNATELIDKLIDKKADINELSVNGITPLIQAIENNNINIVKKLIDNNVDLMRPSFDGRTPLEIAKTKQYYKIAEIIEHNQVYNYGLFNQNYRDYHYNNISYNAFPNMNYNYFDTYNEQYNNNNILEKHSKLLLRAIRKDSIKKAKDIIQLDNRIVNFENKKGITPLLYAIHLNKLNIIDLLISFQANVDAKNKNSLSPLNYALKKGNKDIITILIRQSQRYVNNKEYSQMINEELQIFNNNFIIKYIVNNKNITTKKLEKCKNKINEIKINLSKQSTFFNSLNKKHMSFSNKYNSLVDYNVNNNYYINNINPDIDINYYNDNISSCSSKYTDLDINYQNSKNSYSSYSNNSKDTLDKNNFIDMDIKLLKCIQRGNYIEAERKIRNNFNCINEKSELFNNDNIVTYFVKNPKFYNEDFFEFLINSGGYFTSNVFINEIIYNKKFIELLLNKKFKIKKNNEEKIEVIDKPLHYIIQLKKHEYLESLLKDNELKDKITEEESLIKYIIKDMKDINALNILLNYRRNFFKKDKFGKTPIMYAVESSNKYIINILLQNKFNIDDTDKNGETALFYAVRSKKFDIIKYLIEKGTNVEIKNKEYKNILFLAVESEKVRIVEYLLNKVKENNSFDINNRSLLYYANKTKKKNIINHIKNKGITKESCI